MDLGFLVCRFVRFYGMSRDAVLALPLRTFWFMTAQVGRLRAEEARLSLQVASAAQSGEGGKEFFESLNQQAGEAISQPDVYERDKMIAMAKRHGATVSQLRKE